MARRAGSGRLAWGGRITWTVADGTRGRRWRSVLLDDTVVVGALLLETGLDGRPSKLELATAAGLLTLHPEGATLHGNVVRPTGIEHIAVAWSDAHILLVVGTPVTAAAAARMLGLRVGVGEGRSIPGVSVDVELTVRPMTFRVARPAGDRWQFVHAGGGTDTTVTLDGDGISVLDGAEDWPLELDPDG